jgi:hypothetical protein
VDCAVERRMTTLLEMENLYVYGQGKEMQTLIV